MQPFEILTQAKYSHDEHYSDNKLQSTYPSSEIWINYPTIIVNWEFLTTQQQHRELHHTFPTHQYSGPRSNLAHLKVDKCRLGGGDAIAFCDITMGGRRRSRCSERFKNDVSGRPLDLYRIRILGLESGRIMCILKETGLDQDWKSWLNNVPTESGNRFFRIPNR